MSAAVNAPLVTGDTSTSSAKLSRQTRHRPPKRPGKAPSDTEEGSGAESPEGSHIIKRHRKDPYAHLGSSPLTDRIKDNLDVLFCGENPGIRTAELQLHYAAASNAFWKCLHAARLTPDVLTPAASRTLPEDYNLGITNLIERPTRMTSELNKDEMETAVPLLLAKIARYRPKLVAFVGMKVCETVQRYFMTHVSPLPGSLPEQGSSSRHVNRISKRPRVKVQIGLQSFAVSHSPISGCSVPEITYFYCLPSTSGRVAAYPLRIKLKLWTTFGNEVAKLRTRPSLPLALPSDLVVSAVEAVIASQPVSAPLSMPSFVKSEEAGPPSRQTGVDGWQQEVADEPERSAAPSPPANVLPKLEV